jgi:hypothetical protein
MKKARMKKLFGVKNALTLHHERSMRSVRKVHACRDPDKTLLGYAELSDNFNPKEAKEFDHQNYTLGAVKYKFSINKQEDKFVR